MGVPQIEVSVQIRVSEGWVDTYALWSSMLYMYWATPTLDKRRRNVVAPGMQRSKMTLEYVWR